MRLYWAAAAAVLPDSLGLPTSSAKMDTVMDFRNTPPGRKIESGVELRILPVGDSITVGFGSEFGGDGDGYRRQLRDDLSVITLLFLRRRHLETVTNSSAQKAAWNGKTIQFIADHIDPSLEQRPNVVLVAAGTNDMNPNHAVSTEGNDPVQAANRLGKLVDRIVGKCPDATVLVALIIDTCDQSQEPQTQKFQKLIPGVVQKRRDAGHHVIAVDFATFVPKHGNKILRDCIHPTNRGYKIMGDYWYDFLTQIPRGWIRAPVGKDPSRPSSQLTRD
ncbi:putative endoglucanase X [Beauveria bassiana]|nr:putative endoglucanase X [Beauveria bassiana]